MCLWDHTSEGVGLPHKHIPTDGACECDVVLEEGEEEEEEKEEKEEEEEDGKVAKAIFSWSVHVLPAAKLMLT